MRVRPRNTGQLRARTVALALSACPHVSHAITREVIAFCIEEIALEVVPEIVPEVEAEVSLKVALFPHSHS